MDYELLDSGHEQKLERFGPYTLIRPCPQALWTPKHPKRWEKAHAEYSRQEEYAWNILQSLPDHWNITVEQITFQLKCTPFGHLGIFAEQAPLWQKIQTMTQGTPTILNLFAYSGGATCAAALNGASVTHVDAAKKMNEWAKLNAKLTGLEKAPIRWITDDVRKFTARELRRQKQYDGIILDPPTFGRGAAGEIFKLEYDIVPLLQDCVALLSSKPRFILLSAHTPGVTPIVLKQLLEEHLSTGNIEADEMVLEGPSIIPSGAYALWTP